MMNAEQHTLTVPTSSTAPPEVSVFVSFSGHDIALYFSCLRTSHQLGKWRYFINCRWTLRKLLSNKHSQEEYSVRTESTFGLKELLNLLILCSI